MIYIDLYHGRHTPDEELDEWGFQGPVLGPLPFFHLTYLCSVDTSEESGIKIEDDYFVYKGAYYGDICIIDSLDENYLKRWERTREVLKVSADDVVTLVGHPDEWVKHYAKTILKKGSA